MRPAACILLILLAPAILTAQFDPSNPVFLGLLNRPGPTGGGGPTTLIHDDFTGLASTSISGRTPDTVNTPGNTWSIVNGTWTLDGSSSVNAASGTGAPYNMATIETGVSDGLIITTGRFGASGSMFGGGLYVRASNSSNGWIIRSTRTDPEIRIVERNGGTETDRATSGTVAIASGDVVALWVTLSGSNIDVTMTNLTTAAGVSVSYSSSFNQSVTTHGLYSRGQIYYTEHQEFLVITP